MKIVIYRDKETNRITNHHSANAQCTEENLRAYNENVTYPTKAEIAELEENSIAYYFYSKKEAEIKGEADD